MSGATGASSHTVTARMPAQLCAYLRAGGLGLVITVGEDGFPTDAFSWVVALDGARLRIGADHGSKTLANLRRDGRVAVQIIGPDNLVFLVKGLARALKDDIDAADMGIALWQVDVVGARDQSWPGAAPLPLAVQWSGENRETMIRMEQAVFAEMRDTSA